MRELNIDKKGNEANLEFWSVLPMIFAFGGFFGFIYEELFYLVDLGYLTKRGSTFGPWIPIYGFGAILIYVSAVKWRRKWWIVALVGMLSSFILEYATGYVLYEFFDGLRLWDYNTEIWNWGNIQGYVCARSVVFFGISAIFLMNIVVPLFELFYIKGKKIFFILGCVFSGIAIVDIIIFGISK